MAEHHIVNVIHRGILGGYVNWCSCGASIVEPDGGHEATDAHLAGPPNAPRLRKTRHFTDSEMAEHDRAVAEAAWDAGEHAGRQNQCAWAVWGHAYGHPKANPYRPVSVTETGPGATNTAGSVQDTKEDVS